MDGENEVSASGPVTVGGTGVVSQAEVTPELLEEVETVVNREATAVADAAAILGSLNPSDEVFVEQREILVKGVPTIFNIKRLSYTESSRADAKKYRKMGNGQIVRDLEHEETWGVAYQLVMAVVKNIGTVEAPNWAPLFTIEQIVGKGGRGGIMSASDPAAADFIFQLTNAVWEVNPALNPLTQAAAAAQLGMA